MPNDKQKIMRPGTLIVILKEKKKEGKEEEKRRAVNAENGPKVIRRK